MKQFSKNNFKKKKIYKGAIFMIIIFSAIMYGYNNRADLDEEDSRVVEFSTTTIIMEIQKNSTEVNITKSEPIKITIENNTNKSLKPLDENTTNKTTEVLEISRDEEEEVVLKYFWSKYCVRCWLDTRKGGVLLKRLLAEHPKIEFVRRDIAFDEYKREMKNYKLVGVPSYVLEVNNLSLVMPGPMSKRKIAKIEKAACSVIKDEICRREGY